jgi:hypothetical protein
MLSVRDLGRAIQRTLKPTLFSAVVSMPRASVAILGDHPTYN